MYGKSSLESNWPEPWSFVGAAVASLAWRGAADSNTSIGDGSSWISRIRGGGGYQWVMEFLFSNFAKKNISKDKWKFLMIHLKQITTSVGSWNT